MFSEFLLEQLVPDLEAFLQQGQVLVGEYLREKSTLPESTAQPSPCRPPVTVVGHQDGGAPNSGELLRDTPQLLPLI